MTSQAIQDIEATAACQRATCLYALARRLGDTVKRVATWRESRRHATAVRLQLGVMTERELRDIGLTRVDIEVVATGNFPRAPH
jgi:uncharacterized protein YjiS (DUF1127 family)